MIDLGVKSSAEPAVMRRAEKRNPVVPIGWLPAVFGSNEEVFIVTVPMLNVSLMVWLAPVIGSEPGTVAEVLLETTANDAISPPWVAAAARFAATVKVRDVPRGMTTTAPTTAW